MKKKLLLILLLFNINCTTTKGEEPVLGPMWEPKEVNTVIDKTFEPYIDSFIDASRGFIDRGDFENVSMRFKDFGEGGATVGTCLPMPWHREIDIDRKWWSEHTVLEREELIFHELGHCVLLRPHTQPKKISGFKYWVERFLFRLGLIERKGFHKDGCPKSYMYPYVLSEQCIMTHYEEYRRELFDFVEEEEVLEETIVIEQICKEPMIVNHTDKWSEFDKKVLKRAKYVCRFEYKSCLKTLIKKEELLYNAICGG